MPRVSRAGVEHTQWISAVFCALLVCLHWVFLLSLLLVEHKRARKSHVVGFEGHLTDFINGLDVELPIYNRNGRTKAVIASFPDAVPPDMRDIPYRPLNLAHQHKQGTASRRFAVLDDWTWLHPRGRYRYVADVPA
jgi:hypothetical protein